MNGYEQMRDALKSIKDINDSRPHDAKGYEINDIITDALALPRRQCDVGTVDEQKKRFDDYCVTNRSDDLGCLDCPAYGKGDCEFRWAQMPYEKEGDGK